MNFKAFLISLPIAILASGQVTWVLRLWFATINDKVLMVVPCVLAMALYAYADRKLPRVPKATGAA